jgi:cold shock protein
VKFCVNKNKPNKMTGTIARMKKDNGYGFITPDDGGKDVFFHAQSVVDNIYDELNEGDKITFDLEDGPKGPAATNVRRA